MQQPSGVVDLDSSLLDPVVRDDGKPDLERAGCSASTRGHHATLAVLVGGVRASTFEDRGDQYPVFLRAPPGRPLRVRSGARPDSDRAARRGELGQCPLAGRRIKMRDRQGRAAIPGRSRRGRERVDVTMNELARVLRAAIVARTLSEEALEKDAQHAAGLQRERSPAARRSRRCRRVHVRDRRSAKGASIRSSRLPRSSSLGSTRSSS
jgi:hypothetical protein